MLEEIISRSEAKKRGLPRYFTGVPCCNGHTEPRKTSDRSCPSCARLNDRKSYDRHREKRVAKSSKWNEENPERRKRRYSDNPERYRAYTSKWQKANRDKINAYRRKITATDPAFRLRMNLSNRLSQATKANGTKKSARTVALLGCSIPSLRMHLERQFQRGMTWENYGYGADKWHVDHIAPCSSFDLSDPEQQRQCFHFSNLRPLWQVDNFQKNDRLEVLL